MMAALNLPPRWVRPLRRWAARYAAHNVPAEQLGDHYLYRYYIIKSRWINVYLHRVYKSDEERAYHDHPWWNVSVILDGMYREKTPDGDATRRPGAIVLRSAKAAHRLDLLAGPAVSLFITGPKVREWGFHCPKGWLHNRTFTKRGGCE